MSAKFNIGAKFPKGKPGRCGTGNSDTWKKCKGKHPEPIEYPLKSKGNVKRKGSKNENGKIELYPGAWDRHNGQIVQGKFGLRERFKGAISIANPRLNRYGEIAGNHYEVTSRDNFPVQYHHVIPVSVMRAMSSLKHNVVLVGWDINDGWSNGICLPYNYEDIKRYNLQAHRGGHADYNAKLKAALEDVDIDSEDFCMDEKGNVVVEELLGEMDEFVDIWIQKLIDFKVILHSKSSFHIK